ncbi:Ig-like domain repeat protein, partial [Ignatzschineria indica]|uniref:cadherin domain-containing protein n=1 Tax=Ignatzschineria indica TaxID=472583 RepID=UPI0025757F1D
ITGQDLNGDPLEEIVTVQVDENGEYHAEVPEEFIDRDINVKAETVDRNGENLEAEDSVFLERINENPEIEDHETTVDQSLASGTELYDINDKNTGQDVDVDGDKITYEIISGNDDGLFIIDPETGKITLADGKTLNSEDAPEGGYQLEVKATDDTEDKLSGTGVITIHVNGDSSKITTSINNKGLIEGETMKVTEGPVKLVITGIDQNGVPKVIVREVDLVRPEGSMTGEYSYQIVEGDGFAEGSEIKVEASATDINGKDIYAYDYLPGFIDEENPGLDILEPEIMIDEVGSDGKVIWTQPKEGDSSTSEKAEFVVSGSATGVEEGQTVTITFLNTKDGSPVTLETEVVDGQWSITVSAEDAAKLLDGSVSAVVKDRAGNESEPAEKSYSVDAPTASVTGYYDDIESVQNTVTDMGRVAEGVEISSKASTELAFSEGSYFIHANGQELNGTIEIEGEYGLFTLSSDGEWTYKLNSDAAVSEALIASKGPLTEIFQFQDDSGKRYEVKVSINDNRLEEGKVVAISATTASLLDEPELVESDGNEFVIYSNDSLGEIEGKAAKGVETVRIYINKQHAADDSEMDSLGYPQYFEVAVDEDGYWKLDEATLEEALQTTWWADQLRNDNIYLQVRAVDPTTGKVGDVSEKYTFVVDTVAPQATFVQYDSEEGAVTAVISGDPTYVYHAQEGDKVTVTYIDTNGDKQTVEGNVGGIYKEGKQYLAIKVPVGKENIDESTEFKVYVTDKAGNIGVNNDSKDDPTVIQLPTPKIDQYLDYVDTGDLDVEIIESGGYTNDPSGEISGTVVINAEQMNIVGSVRIFAYGAAEKYIEIDVKDLVPVPGAKDTYRFTTNKEDLGKLTTTGMFAQGQVKLEAAVFDKSGEQKGANSPEFIFTVDMTAPTIEITEVAGGDRILTDKEKEDGLTIKGTVSEHAQVGNKVIITIGNKSYETTVKEGNVWELNLSSKEAKTFEDSYYEVTAQVTDFAGNKSPEDSESMWTNKAPIVTTTPIVADEDADLSDQWNRVEAYDPDSDRLTYEIVPGSLDPSIGTVSNINGVGDFKFNPAKDWSGEASFQIKVTDNYGNSTIVDQKVIINPVADKPLVIEGDMGFDVTELTLNKYVWNGIGGTGYWGGRETIGGKVYDFNDTRYDGRPQGVGNGINPNVLVNGIDALYKHRLHAADAEQTTSLTSPYWGTSLQGQGVPTFGAVYITGFVYLEAGKTYKYVGSADDTGMIIIGDVSQQYVSWAGFNHGVRSSTFEVEESGFYTFDFYMYNQDGIGNYNFKVTEADGSDVKYYPSKEAIAKELPDFVQLDSHLNDPDGNGRGFYSMKYGYKGSETDQINLSKIQASLTDRDGSETLTMKLTGLVQGAELTYTVTHMNGDTEVRTAVAEADGTITVNGQPGELDFKDLVLVMPKDANLGEYDVSVIVTATEQKNGDSSENSYDFTLEVLPPSREVIATEGDDLISTGTTGNDTLIYDLLVKTDSKGGHGVDTWVDFHVGNPSSDDNADMIKFKSGFFEGLTSQDLLYQDSDKVSKFINIEYDEEEKTATLFVDRDGGRTTHEPEPLLILTNQQNEITLEELLQNNQIIIG